MCVQLVRALSHVKDSHWVKHVKTHLWNIRGIQQASRKLWLLRKLPYRSCDFQKCSTKTIFEGCSKFGKRTSSPKKIFRQTFANPAFIFSGTCWPRFLRRTWMCDILKFVPGIWSLVTLHSVAAALKRLRSALRCWSLLTFIGQFWHNKSTV